MATCAVLSPLRRSAPRAARNFQPGQFYRLQNYEVLAPLVDNTRMQMESLAVTGAWVDKALGLISTIVLEMGGSSDLCAHLQPGEPVGEDRLLKFQQAMFATGLYKTVRVQRVKRPQEGIVDLVVEVEETLFFEVEYGAGYGTDTGIRGAVGVKHRNLDGKGRMFSASASVGSATTTLSTNFRWAKRSRTRTTIICSSRPSSAFSPR